MKAIKYVICNLIVIALAVVATLGFFFSPLLETQFKITFTPEIAEMLSSAVNKNTSEENSEKHEMIEKLITALGDERVSLTFDLSFSTPELLNCVATPDTNETEKFVNSIIDSIANSFSGDKIEEIEDSITRAGVKTIIKSEIEKLEFDGKEASEIMAEIGFDDDYVDTQTNALLSAFRDENATVDSISNTVIDIFDDVYSKIDESEYGEQIEPLSEAQKQEIRDATKELLANIADENGNIDGNSVIAELINSVLNSSSSGSESALVNKDATYTILHTEENTEKEEVDIPTLVKQELSKFVTPQLLVTIEWAILGLLGIGGLAVLGWFWLVFKIVVKLSARNPLIKLKMGIIWGALPFFILCLIPSLLFDLLASPPAFLQNFIPVDVLNFAQKIFAGGFTISFNSSSVTSFVCAIILFVFGLFYSRERRFNKKYQHKKKK